VAVPSHKPFGRQPEKAWIRFSFAISACAVTVVLQLLLDRSTAEPMSPFLISIGAIIASAAWGGTVPGLLATFLLIAWAVFDLSRYGMSGGNIAVRCGVFLIEGVILSVGSSRMWQSMKDAASSETWHRELVEAASDGIWVHDEQGVIVWVNARMAEMLGVSADGLPGRNITDFFFPEDHSVERVRAANLRDGRMEHFDRRLRRADGSEMWVLTSANSMRSGSLFGDRQGSLATMTDITERKRAEYTLRRSEERFRNLFENVLEGVYQSTPDGRILAANPMIFRMFGISEEDLNDLNIASDFYLDPHLRERLLERMERDGGYQNVEYELRRRDGEVITVLENARVVRDESGAVLYYEGTMTDVTHRRRMEEQLRQAQKVEALGRLAGSVATDFNNILTVITGHAQLALAEFPDGHSARSNMQQVLDAADRAMGLTQQLLLFSRRQAPGETADLNQAVMHSEAARHAGLTPSVSSEPLPVDAAPEQIERVIRALSAALRSRLSSATLQIRSEPAQLDEQAAERLGRAAAGYWAVISMGDLSRTRQVAELFAGPGAVVMHAGESAAMGVSEAHATVAQCGGFIVTGVGSAEPYPGFHVFLARAVEAGRSAESTPAGQSILLVEEKPLIRELSRDMLERQGYRVVIAANAREAEQASRTAGDFDLLITDAVMPDITGAELARRLREAQPELKVLYIAGYADDVHERPHAPENCAFLHKPFSAESLERTIRQVLG